MIPTVLWVRSSENLPSPFHRSLICFPKLPHFVLNNPRKYSYSFPSIFPREIALRLPHFFFCAADFYCDPQRLRRLFTQWFIEFLLSRCILLSEGRGDWQQNQIVQVWNSCFGLCDINGWEWNLLGVHFCSPWALPSQERRAQQLEWCGLGIK